MIYSLRSKHAFVVIEQYFHYERAFLSQIEKKNVDRKLIFSKYAVKL